MEKNYSSVLWKFTILYFIVALIVYGFIYFFFWQGGGYTAQSPNQYQNTYNTQTTPTVKSDSGLTASTAELDSVNVNQLDAGLNQNTADSTSFAPRVKVKEGTSTNWSGYATLTNLAHPQSNAVSDVKGSWVVPAVTCSATNTYSSAWVGIDGYSDNTVEQTGTEHDCIGGAPSYYAWYEMYPKFAFKVSLAVHAGDTINAEVKYISGNKFQLTLVNATTGRTFTTIQSARASRQSAEWVMEAPWSGGVLPLANFGTVNFTNSQATINGITGGINNPLWQNDPITMVNGSNNPKATPSSLSPDGSSFSVQWNSSN